MIKWIVAGAILTVFACKTDGQQAAESVPSEATQVEVIPPADGLDNSQLDANILPIDEVTGYMDPVCQMKVSADAPIRHTHENVTYGFCSSSCKDRFTADPAKYLAALEE